MVMWTMPHKLRLFLTLLNAQTTSKKANRHKRGNVSAGHGRVGTYLYYPHSSLQTYLRIVITLHLHQRLEK